MHVVSQHCIASFKSLFLTLTLNTLHLLFPALVLCDMDHCTVFAPPVLLPFFMSYGIKRLRSSQAWGRIMFRSSGSFLMTPLVYSLSSGCCSRFQRRIIRLLFVPLLKIVFPSHASSSMRLSPPTPATIVVELQFFFFSSVIITEKRMLLQLR